MPVPCGPRHHITNQASSHSSNTGYVPSHLLLPVELLGNVAPEAVRILDGALVHLIILQQQQQRGARARMTHMQASLQAIACGTPATTHCNGMHCAAHVDQHPCELSSCCHHKCDGRTCTSPATAAAGCNVAQKEGVPEARASQHMQGSASNPLTPFLLQHYRYTSAQSTLLM